MEALPRSPFPVFGLDSAVVTSENAYNLGGGLKVGLRPALAFRLDYRLFVFRESPHAAPRSTHPQRIAVGLSLLF